jgi:hypothetical protein
LTDAIKREVEAFTLDLAAVHCVNLSSYFPASSGSLD